MFCHWIFVRHVLRCLYYEAQGGLGVCGRHVPSISFWFIVLFYVWYFVLKLENSNKNLNYCVSFIVEFVAHAC